MTDFQVDSTVGDTILVSAQAVRNYGASEYMNGAGAFLLYFDLSGISTDNICTAASLKVTHAATSSSATFTDTIYSIASGNAGWTSGTGIARNPAASGEPCWNAKVADGSGGVTTAWAGSEGLSTSGTDYEATAFGTISGNRVNDVGTQYTFTFNAAGISRISGWFGTPNTNYGLVIFSDARSFLATVNNATEAYRPVLTVTYTAAAAGNPHYYYAQL